MMVVTSRAVTVKVEMAESPTESDCVSTLVTFMEYLMVAIEAPVIGKVYAHQASENLSNQDLSQRQRHKQQHKSRLRKRNVPEASEEINPHSLRNKEEICQISCWMIIL